MAQIQPEQDDQPAGGELQNWFPAEAATGRVIDHRNEDEQYTKADG